MRNAALTEELIDNIEQVRASRKRLVTVQDEERRKLERDLHDGAQQQIVALGVKLRLLEQMIDPDPGKARTLAAGLRGEAADALEELRRLAHGIYPPLLADKGLATALESQVRRSVVPTDIRADTIGRYPRDVEAAVYFTCLEALQNVQKYANASRVTLHLSDGDGQLRFQISDDGIGFDPSETGMGTGLQGMADRVAAIGGVLDISSAPGEGTTIRADIPLGWTGS